MIVSDVDDEVEFLRKCFNASGDVAAGRPAEIRIGDSVIMVSDTSERDAFPALLYVYVADADDTYRRGLAAGAMSVEQPRDTPWGDRRAIIKDRYGNVFQIAHRRD
jgi:uncharacterized glyoxalase superfamily protein PhnB